MFYWPVHLVAWTLFLISYAVFAFGRLPGTRIDRQAMAIIGATLMLAVGVLSPARAIAGIDYATVVLLFAMMLLVAGLHLGGFFDFVTRAVMARLRPALLLPAIIFACGILSAFLINDVVCLFMAPLVLNIARRWNLPPVPYLLALATGSNIGGAASITGNPQNILIGSVSHIGYLRFLSHLGPVALIGLFLDWAVLHWFLLHQPPAKLQPPAEAPLPDRPLLIFPLLVTLGVLAAFLAGVNPALAAAIAAAALLFNPHYSSKELFAEVDWGLLVFFLGLFLVLAGAQQSGIAAQLLAYAAHWNLQRPALFTLFTVLLSNLVSNVPAVMLLQGVVRNFADPQRAWLLLAMASTLAGNLTITGSIANIIVVEKAAAADGAARIGFWQYARVGVPVTLLTTLVGWAWLRFLPY